jgi:hypothetical protein
MTQESRRMEIVDSVAISGADSKSKCATGPNLKTEVACMNCAQ